MTEHDAQVARLRALCPGAELWDDGGDPLVFLPGLKVLCAGETHTVDGLLCPRARDGYDTRLFFAEQLPVNRNWGPHVIKALNWYAFSWSGIPADQPWLDILAGHIEAVKGAEAVV
ncbi:hypothetical protein LC612_34520 [Nostoc sp. CHAB 5834]|nr:hypothetical protein [Nostoc sp. CHAB 5834]